MLAIIFHHSKDSDLFNDLNFLDDFTISYLVPLLTNSSLDVYCQKPCNSGNHAPTHISVQIYVPDQMLS